MVLENGCRNDAMESKGESNREELTLLAVNG